MRVQDGAGGSGMVGWVYRECWDGVAGVQDGCRESQDRVQDG